MRIIQARLLLPLLPVLLAFSCTVAADAPKKWCGKCYEAANRKNPECNLQANSFFNNVYPVDHDLHVFTCNTRFSGYEPSELQESETIEIIIDAGTVPDPYASKEDHAQHDASKTQHTVTIYGANDQVVATENIQFPSRSNVVKVQGHKLGASDVAKEPEESDYKAKRVHYRCSLTSKEGGNGKDLHTRGSFDLLPEREKGSIVVVDYLTGALKAKKVGSSSHDQSTGPTAFFPFGFYTSYDWLQHQKLDEALAMMKQHGLTLLHPVPDYDKVAEGNPGSIKNVTALLDAAEKAGLWVAYDLRNSYQNDSSVTTQVNTFKYHPAVLTFYTADEPDQGDPLDATTKSYDLIRQPELDGGAHPVSLVLNCADYNFDRYARGAEILAQDAYSVSVNTTFSRRWNTTCTVDFGDCGCDNCGGVNNLSDSTVRNQVFQTRLSIMEASQNHDSGSDSGNGTDSTHATPTPVKGRTPIWAVLQGFGAPEEYWPRGPTVDEFVVMAVGGFARGASGIMPWEYSIATKEIRTTANSETSEFITALSKVVLWDKHSTSSRLHGFRVVKPDAHTAGVDVGGWKTSDGRIVLLLANPGNGDKNGKYSDAEFQVDGLGVSPGAQVQTIFDSHQGKSSIHVDEHGSVSGHLGPLQAKAIVIQASGNKH